MGGPAALASSTWHGIRAFSLPGRLAIVVGVGFGIVGAAVGLVLGLRAHPPTAWFAVLALGMVSAWLGAVLGAIVGGVVQVVRRLGSAPGAR